MGALNGESYPQPMNEWGRDLVAVQRGQLTFDDLYRRHGAYVTQLARPWTRKCPPYMSRDDYRQEIWTTVAEAIRTFDPSKGVPVSGWIGWKVKKRLQRLAEQAARSNAHVHRYMDYLIVEERIVTTRGIRRDGFLTEGPSAEPVTQPGWEAEYDAQRLMITAVSAMPNARSSNLIAKVLAGAKVKDAAPATFPRCRRPNKAAHRAIAQARAAVEIAAVPNTIEQTLAQTTVENDNKHVQAKPVLRPLRKARRTDPGQRTKAFAAG